MQACKGNQKILTNNNKFQDTIQNNINVTSRSFSHYPLLYKFSYRICIKGQIKELKYSSRANQKVLSSLLLMCKVRKRANFLICPRIYS